MSKLLNNNLIQESIILVVLVEEIKIVIFFDFI